MNNQSSLCCEYCGRIDTLIQNTVFGITLCPDCNKLFNAGLNALIEKYTKNTDDKMYG